MKLLLILFSLLFALPLYAHDGHGKSAHPATARVVHAKRRPISFRVPNLLARCSGGANCNACSNCNYCGHCAGGGGTCSVCADYSTPVRRVSRPARSYNSSRSTRSIYTAPARPKTTLEVSGDYYVSATTLNLRAEPSADAEVVRVLEKNDVVTVQELTDAKWAKVSVNTVDGEIEGYLSRAYLSDTPSY